MDQLLDGITTVDQFTPARAVPSKVITEVATVGNSVIE